MLETDTLERAEALLEKCRGNKLKLATAESCTGGLIAAALTHIAGSSDVFERGFVTYSNEAKTELLGVPAPLIQRHGAVSEEIARAMAEGALAASHTDIAISVTGVAGPGGGSAEKPVGLVWFGCARKNGACVAYRKQFTGDRGAVRSQAVIFALSLIEAAQTETREKT
jgi:nicotinamide-nucleotide amidase